MDNIDEEMNKYKKVIDDNEREKKALLDAKIKLSWLEQQKKEMQTQEEQANRIAKDKAVYANVDPDYSQIYIKVDGYFLPAEKFWLANNEFFACATDKNGKIKFARQEGNADPLFVEKFRPKVKC
jgi:hypothetical protein